MRCWRTGQTKVLGEELGTYKKVHPNDHVNYGQSTNDVFPTAMRLAALLALEELYPVLDALAGSFTAKAEEFRDVLKAGRTHMQDAVPITLGQEFVAYAVAVRECEAAIRRGSVGAAGAGARWVGGGHGVEYASGLPGEGCVAAGENCGGGGASGV